MTIPKFDPSKITSAEKLETKPIIKALLLGPSKSGKTTALATLPGHNLLVDLDGRAESISGFPNIDIIKISESTPESGEAWNELHAMREWLWANVESEDFPYSGVMFDGLSAMNRFAMSYVMTLRTAQGKLAERGFGGTPAQHHYNPYMAEMSKFIFNMLALPIHVIFTGHYYVYEDSDTNRLEWWPKVFGNIRTEIGSWFNETYALSVNRRKTSEGEKHTYYWQTSPDKQLTFVGSSMNKLGKYWQSPVTVDFNSLPCGFEALMAERYGDKK